MEKSSEINFLSWRAGLLLLSVSGISLAITAIMAGMTGAPFVMWFPDAWGLLAFELANFLLLGLLWDGSLIAAAFLRRAARRFKRSSGQDSGVLGGWRKIGFFSRGPWPIVLVILTSCAALGTSNLTLINLTLLRTATEWRDPLFWALEGPLIAWLTQVTYDTRIWDAIYHSVWGLELLAVFVLILSARRSNLVLGFCMSFVLLFYLGRMLGLLNPVMGPAFYQPQLFGYLEGSVTGAAIQLVDAVMQDPELTSRSAVLLGGVSAMPSLHVGMVTLTTWWLAAAARWTLVLTLPWAGFAWAATVILGWHYILDGAAGIALALVCVSVTRYVLQRSGTWFVADSARTANINKGN